MQPLLHLFNVVLFVGHHVWGPSVLIPEFNDENICSSSGEGGETTVVVVAFQVLVLDSDSLPKRTQRLRMVWLV
jgi:hypothetical protein